MIERENSPHTAKYPHGRVRHDMKSYMGLEIDEKLTVNIRDLGHTIRFYGQGKGGQKQILKLLYDLGDMTQRELTQRLGIRPGSASEVIGKLENAGLIVRETSRTDRRTADIRLTEYGRAKALEAIREKEAYHRKMFSCLSPEEKASLLALTEKLNGYWDDHFRENNDQMN